MQANAERIELVILDMVMPDMNARAAHREDQRRAGLISELG